MAKRKQKKKQPTLNAQRNPIALNPLLQKGGVHEEPNKAKRKKAKMAMKKALSKQDFDGAFSIFGLGALTSLVVNF